MRLLLDECVPRPLKRDLSGHDVWHVVDMGWSSKRNGELLRLMVSEHFEAFLTVDQNLEFQQNLKASGVGVIVALARTNRVKELPAGCRCSFPNPSPDAGQASHPSPRARSRGQNGAFGLVFRCPRRFT